MTHDQLHAACHMWMHNEYPELRHLFHGNLNNLTSYSDKSKDRIKMSKLQHLGHCLKGRLDYEFFYQSKLHVFDFKVGKDKLSPHQIEYIKQTEAQGGKGYEIRSLEQFKDIIHGIIIH